MEGGRERETDEGIKRQRKEERETKKKKGSHNHERGKNNI